MSIQTRDTLETLVLVTVITVLVWLYAEGEVVRTYREPVPVKFVAPPGQGPLMIDPESSGETGGVIEVEAIFRASAGQIQTITQSLREGPIEVPVEPPSEDAPDGVEQEINLRQALANSRLGQLGVNIADTNPVSETVHVESMKTITRPIRVKTGDIPLSEPATVEPQAAELEVPASRVARAQNWPVVAEVNQRRLRAAKPGQSQTLSVNLDLADWVADQPAVQLKQRSAKVTLTLDNNTESLVLEAVPIRVNAPASLLERYSIHLPADRRQVRLVQVAGPAEAIDRIRSGQFEVWAEIRPTEQRLEKGRRQAPLSLHLPPEVTARADLPPVSFRVEREGSQ